MAYDYVVGGNSRTKTFTTDTLIGLKAAERFKSKLEAEYNQVVVIPAGLNRVHIFGRDKL